MLYPHSKLMTKPLQRGYTMVEMLGVIGIIMLLVTIGTLGYNNFKSAGEKGVADHNATTLNSAIAQYNQAGGLMTAQVPMVVGEEALDASAAVMQVYCRLANSEIVSSEQGGSSKEGGGFMATHQKPVLSNNPDDFRVVWLSGVTNSSAAELTHSYKTASGVRNPLLEAKLESGEILGGSFVTVGPDLYANFPQIATTAVGIKTFSRNGTPCASSVNATAAPLLVGDAALLLTLSDPNAGTVTGSGTYENGASVPYTVILNPGWEFKNWTEDMAGQPEDGTIVLLTPVKGTGVVAKKKFTVTLDSTPPEGGSVSGSGIYEYEDTLSFSAVPNTGWEFVRWEGGLAGEPTVGTKLVTAPISASAVFSQAGLRVTILAGEGGTTNPEPKSYIFIKGDTLDIAATTIWDTAWDAPRYRWDSFELKLDSTISEPRQSFTHIVEAAGTIQPIFVQQFYVEGNSSSVSLGNITLQGVTNQHNQQLTLDKGTTVTMVAEPDTAVARFMDWSDGDTSPSKSFSLSGDTKLTANFTDMQDVTVNIIDQYGNPVSSDFYTLTDLAIGSSTKKIGEESTFTVTPKDVDIGYITDVTGATITPITGDIKDGVTGTFTPVYNAPVVVTVTMFLNRQLVLVVKGSAPTSTSGTITNAQGVTNALTQATCKAVVANTTSSERFIGTRIYQHTHPENWMISYTRALYYINTTVTTFYDYVPSNVVVYDQISDKVLGTFVAEPIDSAALSAITTIPGISGPIVGRVYSHVAGYSTPVTTSAQYWTSWWYSLSPVVIDVFNTGSPDLLAGADSWRKGDTAPITDALRPFMMDGITPGNWEWIGPKLGLLVFNPTHDHMLQPTGYSLFGNFFGGQEWADGYLALATLDFDKDGTLQGDELKDIWVWLDANSDAIVQEGELKPAAEHDISLINVAVVASDDGNKMSDIGAVVGGAVVKTWDWWPTGVKNDIITYSWTMDGIMSGASGLFKFTNHNGILEVESIPAGMPIEGPKSVVTRAGNLLKWAFGPLSSVVELLPDGSLHGTSTIDSNEMQWIAIPTSGKLE